MSFTYSRQSLKFLEIAYRYLTYLGLAPNYNFDKKIFIKLRLYKLYCVALTFVIVCTFLCRQYIYWTYLIESYVSFVSILNLMSLFVMHLLCSISIISSAFWNNSNWRRLFRYFSIVEDNLKTGDITETSFIKNFYFQYFLIHVIIVVVSVNSFIPWFFYATLRLSPIIVILEIFYLYLQYVKSIKMVIIYNIALALKCKYQDLNHFLTKGCCSRISEIPKIVQIVSSLYGLMGKSVETFNSLFGWEILLSVLHSVTVTLACFNYGKIFYSKIVHESLATPIQLFVNFIILGIISMVSDFNYF